MKYPNSERLQQKILKKLVANSLLSLKRSLETPTIAHPASNNLTLRAVTLNKQSPHTVQ
jgi:hypothetical protein